jgi:hypothetical protein
MKLLSLTPMLATTDLPRQIAFHTRLGFTLDNTFGDPPVWACLSRDGVEIMFNAPPRDEVLRDCPPKSRNYQIFYFKPDDIAALHHELTTRGLNPTPLCVTVCQMK